MILSPLALVNCAYILHIAQAVQSSEMYFMSQYIPIGIVCKIFSKFCDYFKD